MKIPGNDHIIIPNLDVDEKIEQPTGLLAKDGKSIVRKPLQVGFNSSHVPTYALKND